MKDAIGDQLHELSEHGDMSVSFWKETIKFSNLTNLYKSLVSKFLHVYGFFRIPAAKQENMINFLF